MPVDKHELAGMVSAARQDLTEAESELVKVLGEIRVALRAEKTAVTTAVEDAFTKLRRAKTRLAELEAELVSDRG
jgi:hypothetical protein